MILFHVYIYLYKNMESNSDNNKKSFIELQEVLLGNLRTNNLVPPKTYSIHTSGSALQKFVF